MKKDKKIARSAADVAQRRRAEGQLNSRTNARPPRTDDETQRLVHELELLQIQLETQNAELGRAKEELELARNRYAERYDQELIVHERTRELSRVDVQLSQEIDENILAVETAKKTAEKFRAIADYTYDWESWFAPDGSLLWVNPAVEKFTGYSRTKWLNQPYPLAQVTHEDDYALVFSILEKGLKERHSGNDIPFRVHHTDGSIRWAAISYQPIYAEDGVFIGLRTSVRDITDRKRTEDQIVTLALLKDRLIGTINNNEKLRAITDGLVEIFNADFARIWLIREGDLCEKGCLHADSGEGPDACRDRTRCLHLVASSGRYTHIDGNHRRVPFGCYNIGCVALGEDISYITNDVTSDPRIQDHEWAQALGLVSFAGFRLISAEGAPIGVLALFGRQAILPIEEGLMLSFFNYLSQVIQLDLSREALLESEQRFQLFMQHFPGLAYIKDSECRTIYANRGFLTYLGIDPAEIIGKTNFEILPAGFAEKITNDDRCVLNSDLSEEHVECEDVFEEHTWLTRKFAIPMTDKERMLGGISIDITERKLLEEKLHALSMVDELTGLYNRRGFLTLAEQQLKIAERSKESIVLFFIDLDYLKWINDTLGHQEGDSALVETAAIIRQTFRKSDIIGRMGGDEFAILAIDPAHEERKAVARLRGILDSYNMSETRSYKLSLSVGTAHFDPENPISLDDLIARADNLMYEEKRSKRN